MLYPNPHMQLMGALQFSAFDLYANQQGRLSPIQRKQIETRRLQHLEAWVGGLMLFWAGGLLLVVPFLVLVFFTAVSLSIMIAIWRRGEDDLQDRVETVTGQLEQFAAPFPLGGVVKVGEAQFRVSRLMSSAFAGSHIYRLYFTSGSHTLLSAEVLS
jgi:hypothetical protein